MINFNHKVESIAKITLLIFFLLSPTSTLAEINDKEWTKQCKNNVCLSGITKFFKDSTTGKIKNLSTAYIILNPNKATEAVLKILIPLGTDLSAIPLVMIDGKKIGNLVFLYCKANQGCMTELGITNVGVKEFKKGKIMSVYFRSWGKEENYILEFTLKGFTKSYSSIAK